MVIHIINNNNLMQFYITLNEVNLESDKSRCRRKYSTVQINLRGHAVL